MIKDELTQFFTDQTPEIYEESHHARLDFLVSDLRLDKLEGIVGDFGCGYGPIYKRIPQAVQKNYIGFDAADIKQEFAYVQCDLSQPFPKIGYTLDNALCFETLEHLTNPYNLIYEIKSILKNGGLLYLSIPEIRTEHNAPYPGLLYPESNFEEFMRQMAFEIVDKRLHDKSFTQWVYILKNLPWEESKLKFPLSHPKYRGKAPHEAVNI